ncbi:MAG: B12-binding domain-containing radical SAM protein [Verrucomicrobiales bacterium]|nr:B12-binding domain-containing radical SAM protein [Verrucomicrobiales bacterium]
MKLGLIALSGVRCHNQELLDLGLTLPGFVERSKVIASLPSLGLLTLAGMTPVGVEVSYLEVPDVAALRGGLPPGDFDAVAISSFTAQIKEAYRLADRYRAAGVTVLLGGLHVTLCPDEAAAHADAIVIGEAEPVWGQVIGDLLGRRLAPRYDARGAAFDLRDAPMPRFELLEISNYNRLTVQTQRGCPFHCDFCAASIRLNPKFRTKPVAKVLAEIHRIKDLWPHPFIEFADDNSFADKRHGRELARALIPEGLRWFAESDVSVADDPELLRLLKESGCAQILIGLESPTAQGLEGLEHKSNWKRRQLDRYRAAVAAIQDAGITVNGCFVLGLDGSGTTSFEDVFTFVRDTGLYEVQITVMTPFPATPLYHRLQKQGRLLEEGAWEKCTLFDVNFLPDKMSVEELEHGFRELGRRIYDADFIEERRRRFFKRQAELRRSEFR